MSESGDVSEESTATEFPWLGVALGIGVVGVAIVAMLSAVDAPPPPAPAQLVQHVPVDVGDWDPFPDVGVRSDAAVAGKDSQ